MFGFIFNALPSIIRICTSTYTFPLHNIASCIEIDGAHLFHSGAETIINDLTITSEKCHNFYIFVYTLEGTFLFEKVISQGFSSSL